MPTYLMPQTNRDIPVSSFLGASPVSLLDPISGCCLLSAALQDGIDLVVWKGELKQPIAMDIQDDWDRVHFSYALQGCSRFSIEDEKGKLEHVLQEGSGCISYTLSCKGRSSYVEHFEIVTVSIRPDILATWAPELGNSLRHKITSRRCYAPCSCNAEMRATAQALSRALHVIHLCPDDETNRTPLWLLGQSLVLVSLAIESHGTDQLPCEISLSDRHKILRAKDHLVKNLSAAPTIAALAREVGLSVLKLKRGFRQVFNNSVYGLFQQERMHEARRRLCTEDTPVLIVASDLGYTNASHFAAAFQKQFGVNPSALRRRK